MISDHLAQALLAKVNKTRMVAERLLDLRRPNFSLPRSRALVTMASPDVANVFLRPPMMDYAPNNENLQDFVHMGAAGAIAIQAVMTGGGRIVQGMWNWAAKKWQLVYDEKGDPIDFPTQPAQQFMQLMDIEMERPTPPRPANASNAQQDEPQFTNAAIAQRDHNHDNNNDDPQQAKSSFGKWSKKAVETMSIHSKSPETPTVALFQDVTDDDEKQTDKQTKADRDKIARGKWADSVDKDTEVILNENMLLNRRLTQYETSATKDPIWENDPYNPVLVTQMSPNAPPSKDMKYIADNIEQWIHKAIQTGIYLNRPCFHGIMMV